MGDLVRVGIKYYADLSELKKGSEQAKKVIEATAKSPDRIAREVAQKMTTAFTNTGYALRTLGRDINRYVTLPLIGLGAISSNVAYEFNKGLGNVQTLIPNTNGRIEELKENVIDLAGVTGKSLKEINDALYRTISVFQDNVDTAERLNVAVRASVAGYSTAEEAVALLASVTRAYGDTSADAVSKVANLAFETVRLGDTTFPALAKAMQVATDRADRLNLSQEELFATFATLTGITGNASMVATQFRSAMDSLLKPTKELNQLVEQLGYASAEALLQERGLAGTFVAIRQAAEKANIPLQTFITRKEGITLASRLSGEQLKDFEFKLKELALNTNAFNDAFRAATEGVNTFGFKLDQSRRKLDGALATLGEKFLPILTSIVDLLATMVTGFNSLDPIVQVVIGGVLTLVVVLGTLASVVGGLIVGITGLTKAWAAYTVAQATAATATATAGATIGSVMATALPWLGVITAVVAGVSLVAGAVVSAEQRKQEEIAKTNELIRQQTQVMKATLDTAPLKAIADTRTALLTDKYVSEGRIPTLTSSRRQSRVNAPLEAGLEPVGTFIDIPKITSDSTAEEIKKARDLTKDLIKETEMYLEVMKKTEPRELTRIRTLSEEVRQLGDLALNRKRIAEITQKYGLSGLNLDDIKKQRDVLGINLQNSLKVPSNYLQVQVGLGETRTVEGDTIKKQRAMKAEYDELVRISELEQKRITLLAEIDILKAQNVGTSIEEQAEVEARLYALQQNLLQLDQVFSGVGKGKELKTWQQWFEDITGIMETRFGNSGLVAGELYIKGIQEAFDNTKALSDLLGEKFSATDFYTSKVDEIKGNIDDLLAIQANEIRGGLVFQLIDNSIKKMIEAYRMTVNNAVIATAEEVRESWSSVTKVTFDVLKTRVEETKTVMDNLPPAVDKFSMAWASVAYNQNLAFIQLAGYKMTLEEVIALQNERDKGNSMSDNIFKGLQGFFPGQDLAPQLEELSALNASLLKDAWFRPEKVAETSAAIGELKKSISSVIEENFKLDSSLASVSVHFADFLVQAGNLAVTAMYDLGKAMFDAGEDGKNLTNVFSNLAFEILKMIPQLMIKTGLDMLSKGNMAGLALVAGGIAGQIGVGFLDSYRQSGAGEGPTATFAKGTVLTSPTYLSSGGSRGLAGEAGPEGILPLTRNSRGELGVHSTGGSNVEVNIYNEAGDQVEQRVSDDGSKIDIFIKKAVKQLIGSGAVDKEMRGRYGIRTY